MKGLWVFLALVGFGASVHAEHPSCEGLRERVAAIDAQARHRSTQYLTDSRRETLKQLRALGCSEMRPVRMR